MCFSPIGPEEMDWSVHYPAFVTQQTGQQDGSLAAQEMASSATRRQLTQQVEVADIGCGFGGLLFALAPKMPNTLIMGQCCSLPTTSKKEVALTQAQAWKSGYQ